MVLSNIFTLFKTPKDNVAGRLIAPIIILNMIVAFLRESLKTFIKEAIAVSIILIPEVIAAKNKSTKKIKPVIDANGNCANISGSEINTKVAPAEGSTPKENTIGKIIIPAVTAIRVSKKINVYDDFIMFVSFFI